MPDPNTALGRIRGLDYTVIRTRDMSAMRRFYETVMRFPLEREEGRPQQFGSDVVEECGEPFLLPVLCHLPYAVQGL